MEVPGRRPAPISVDEMDRIICDYREAWEGRCERVADLGDAMLRIQPTYGEVLRFALAGEAIETRLDALISEVSELAGRCLWILGPRTQPADLGDRLLHRGFNVFFDCEGLVLDDIDVDIPRNPDVVIEPLSRETAVEYAARCSESSDQEWDRYLLASAHRYLDSPTKQVQIFVARVAEAVAGYSVLRIEPTGIAYLANAMTVPEFRGRGVYSSLTAHRLRLARAAGCHAAFCAAQTRTSAPILRRWGFTPRCQFRFITPPRTNHS